MRSRSGVPQVHKVARRSRLRRLRDQPCHHHSAELGELVGLAQDHKFVGRFLRRIAVARCEEDQNAEQALALEQRPLRFPCLRAGGTVRPADFYQWCGNTSVVSRARVPGYTVPCLSAAEHCDGDFLKSLNSWIVQANLAWMKRASITEAKNNLSALIDGLKAGSPVLIVDRGRPVARLEPVTSGREPGNDGRLLRLIREGIVRPGRVPLSRALFGDQPPRPKGGASAVRALIEERRQSR